MSQATLLKDIESNGGKLFLQFGGQGAPFLKELSKLYAEPGLKEFFETAFSAVAEEIPKIENKEFVKEGYDFKSWVENPDSAPSETYLSSVTVSIVGIFFTQMANYVNMTQKGYPQSDLLKLAIGATGHSQGIIAAALLALGKEGKEFYEALAKFTKFIFYVGYRAQETYPDFAVPESVVQAAEAIGDKNPGPMVACIGYSKDELEERVKAVNEEKGFGDKDRLYISLYNTPDSMIISAPPASLIEFRKKYKAEMDERKGKFVYLKTTAPFHSPHVKDSEKTFPADMERIGFDYTGADLKIPVFSFHDGRNMQKDDKIGFALFREVLIEALHWDLAVKPFFSEKTAVGIDFGPSPVSQKLTQAHLGANSAENKIYCASSPKDTKVLFA